MDEALARKRPAKTDVSYLCAGAQVTLGQFRRQSPVHAYLISGAQGLGKETFAKVLACALFCEDDAQRPCGVCAGCRRVLDDQSPDVILVTPEGGKQIGVERVREVIGNISRLSTGFRVVLIKPAERLTPQAQNCLLKSLEEPVSNVVFLLLAHEMTALLGTIASRCARIKLTPWPDSAMLSVLSDMGYSQAEIRQVLPLASGNIGRAIDKLSPQEDEQDIHAFLESALTARNDADVVRVSTGLKESREQSLRYLAALEQALHQSLLIKTGQLPPDALKGLPGKWQASLLAATAEGLTGLLRAVFEARRLRFSQVNWQSSIDHLMMKILEEQKKWRQSLV